MSHKNLHFVINRINEIKIALFHCQSKSVLKIPTSIITTHHIDDDGSILFFMSRPKQLISQFDKEFPVRLNYFRKGVNYYLNVQGIGRIINDPEELLEYELSFDEVERALKTEVLINVKILKAEYFEKDTAGKNILTKARSFIYNLLSWVEPEAKLYDFSSRQLHNYGF